MLHSTYSSSRLLFASQPPPFKEMDVHPMSRYAPWSRTTLLARRPPWTLSFMLHSREAPHIRAGRLRILSSRFANVKTCALAASGLDRGSDVGFVLLFEPRFPSLHWAHKDYPTVQSCVSVAQRLKLMVSSRAEPHARQEVPLPMITGNSLTNIYIGDKIT